jgi:transposase
MSESRDNERARKRAAVIFAVRSGRITVEEGAKQLGVSRKTYYEWERRALQAMTGALENGSAGRPGTPRDEEKARLEAEIAALQNKLFVAEKTVEVRDMLHAYELQSAGAKKSAVEKKRRQKKKQ